MSGYQTYEPRVAPTSIGYTSIRVLSFLDGQPWDDLARAYVHALRPSCVRVSSSFLTSDARSWRVTVMTTEDGIIRHIEQEVDVDLGSGKWPHGHALQCEIEDRLPR